MRFPACFSTDGPLLIDNFCRINIHELKVPQSVIISVAQIQLLNGVYKLKGFSNLIDINFFFDHFSTSISNHYVQKWVYFRYKARSWQKTIVVSFQGNSTAWKETRGLQILQDWYGQQRGVDEEKHRAGQRSTSQWGYWNDKQWYTGKQTRMKQTTSKLGGAICRQHGI